MCSVFFFFNDTATTEIYTLSLHDALPIYRSPGGPVRLGDRPRPPRGGGPAGGGPTGPTGGERRGVRRALRRAGRRPRFARPGTARAELGAAGEEGAVLAPPAGTRDRGTPLGPPDGPPAARAAGGQA